MNRQIFASLPAQTQAALAAKSSAVAGVVPDDVKSWQIDISGLTTEPNESDLIREVSEWAGNSKNCLYYFRCLTENVDLALVERSFAIAKAHEANDRAYPRLNDKGAFFYVGSSQSIAKRFREHLGYGPKRTYALQLIHWARRLAINLEFVCAKYPTSTPYEVIQDLEDTLWESHAPMFGRQGRK